MSNEQGGYIPHVTFDIADLEGIERVVWAYSLYLQKKAPVTEKNIKKRETLEKIQGRLAAQLKEKDVQLFLDVEELEELLETMLDFAQLIKRMFPQNESRDGVLASVNAWRLRLIHIVSEFDVEP